MVVAYIINQYPKISHSFIRREIAALEATGLTVKRYAIRSAAAELVDEADKQELCQTRLVLKIGTLGLLVHLIRTALFQPMCFISALWLTLTIGSRSERGMLIHLVYLAEACVVLRWCCQESVDHIHAHFGTNSTTVAMLVQALGGPSYSFTVHGPEEFDKVQSIALPQKIDRAAFVVAVSEFGRSQLYRWCEYTAWKKIHVVRCGVDALFLQRSLLPLPRTTTFVCVGRLCEQKGHLLLLRSAALLASQGIEFQLILVGDGPLRSQIEAYIASHQMTEHIKVIGWASNYEVRQQILAAQVMVLPSFAEGLPVSIMEALALGRPVISTYIAGIPELVEPNVSGWLVPAGAVKPLADAMRAAAEMPSSQLKQMGQRGFEKICERHNLEVEAAKLAKLLHSHACII